MEDRAERSRRLWPWMIPILLLAMFLASIYLNANPLWGDERFTVSSTGGVFDPIYTLPQVWESVAVGHVQHLPGFMMMVNLSIRLVGAEPGAMRFLSLFIGLLGIAWTYRVARIAFPWSRAGLFAALILGTSMLMTNYMIVVRMYTLLVAMTSFVIACYLSIVLRRRPSRWLWVGLFVGMVILIYTHYLGALSLAALGVLHLVFYPQARRQWNRRWWSIVGVFAASALCFLPWLPHFINGVNVEAAHNSGSRYNLMATLDLFVRAFGNSFSLIAVAAVALIVFARGRRVGLMVLLAVATALAMLAYFAVSNRIHRAHTAYLIGIWPLAVVLVGYVIASWTAHGGLRRAASLVVLACLVVSGVKAAYARDMTFMIDSHRYLFPSHSVDAALRNNGIFGEHVAIALPDGLSDIDYRSSRIAIEDAQLEMKVADFVTYGGPRDGAIARAEEAGDYQFSRWERAWVAYDATLSTSSRRAFDQAVAADFRQCPRSFALGRVQVDQYAQALTCCIDNDSPPAARFGSGIALTAIGLPSQPVTEATLDVVQLWSVAADVPPQTYSVTVQLWDATGNKVAQHDDSLGSGSHPCAPVQLDVGALNPGAYAVMVGVYDWHDGQRLLGALAGSSPTTDLIPIGSVTLS